MKRFFFLKNRVNKIFPHLLIKVAGLVIFICMLSACKKSKVDDKPGTHYKFDSSLSMVSLQAGNYFIYRDSATHTLDSVVVTKSFITPDIYYAGYDDCLYNSPTYGCDPTLTIPPYYYDQFSLELTDFPHSSVWLSMIASSYPRGLILLKNADDDTKILMWYPFSAYNQDHGTILNLASMNVQGELYMGVHRFETNFYVTPGSDITRSVIYWVPGVGIIKRTIVKGGVERTEELVRRG